MTADKAVTSDLTIDESLILHSIGWEPRELVCGAGVFSIQQGSWTWAVGEIGQASYAVTSAFEAASDRLRHGCSQAGGHGVVGVEIEVNIEHHVAEVILVGTAVAPVGAKASHTPKFASDLSARDFALLHNAGWEPKGLAFGASFVHVPRRGAGAALGQSTQNVELGNFTQAMYSARDAALARMQSTALTLQATGVVDVEIREGPMEFARHAIGFTAWGTAVKLGPGGHRSTPASVVVPLDDAVVTFAAGALRGD